LASRLNQAIHCRRKADNLEAILKSTAHPKTLVAVKKSGTLMGATPSMVAKPQFLAGMHE